MRFVNLKVEDFMCIESAEVDFAAGLNVLHGPNDLGKSSLAAAIRAALLIPVKSSRADDFIPWHRDAKPTVSLVFVGPDQRYYKVSKRFSRSSGNAELRVSNDGKAFRVAAKGREVDGRLAEMLSWGVRAPGGERGRAAIPESFLTTALLAEQTEVDAILKQSFEDDRDESGKLRLTEALGALAQNKLFKAVLDQAQSEYDRFFTATGRKRGGAGSPFRVAAERVSELQEDVKRLREELNSATSAKAHIRSLNRKLEEKREDEQRLVEELEQISAAWQQIQARAAAQQQLDIAQRRVEEISALERQLGADQQKLKVLEQQCQDAEQALTAARGAAEQATTLLEQAKEAERRAKSDDAARELQLRLADIDKQLAELASEKKDAEARRAAAEAAKQASLVLDTATKEVAAAQARAEAAEEAVEQARAQLAEAETGQGKARTIESYGRWRKAVDELEKMRGHSAQRAQLLEEAQALQAKAEESADGGEDKALPDKNTIETIRDLELDLRHARASLGGGFSVALKPRQPIDVSVRIDEASTQSRTGTKEAWIVEADRSAEIGIGDVADIVITAGEADARARAETLEARWEREAEPVLTAAGVETVEQLQERRTRADSRADAVARLKEQAAIQRERAENLSADPETEQSLRSTIENLASDFADTDRSKLEAVFSQLGSQWEKAVRKMLTSSVQTHTAAREQLNGAQSELSEAREELAAAKTTKAGAEKHSKGKAAEDFDKSLASAQALLERLDSKQAQLQSEKAQLAGEAPGQVKAIESVLSQAASGLEQAKTKVSQAEGALARARSDRDSHTGQLTARNDQLQAINKDEVQSALQHAQKEYDRYPVPDKVVSEADRDSCAEHVRLVRAELTTINSEVNQAEGALKSTGGAVVEEQHRDMTAAWERACDRQRDVDVDAEAWKLLAETLREVENSEGAHLGRALAEPVAARFAELTGGRYSKLGIGPTLETQEVYVESAGAPEGAVDKLSVGTREQLATLLRLAISEALKSAIILDDQLVQTDPKRLEWFRALLVDVAKRNQVIVLTCRPGDYPDDTNKVDLVNRIHRWKPERGIV